MPSFAASHRPRPAPDAGPSDSAPPARDAAPSDPRYIPVPDSPEKPVLSKEKTRPQPPLSISLHDDQPRSRTTSSASSGFDPYYFQDNSPTTQLSLPPMPDPAHPADGAGLILPISPAEPTTPGRDPAVIDRRGLIGLGELATPRWTSSNQTRKFNWDALSPAALVEEPDRENPDDDSPDRDDGADSPWTIEAVDGDQDGEPDDGPPASAALSSPLPPSEAASPVKAASTDPGSASPPPHVSPAIGPALLPPARGVRGKPSLTEESGGEEILYPRKLRDHPAAAVPPLPSLALDALDAALGPAPPHAGAAQLLPASAPPDATAFDAPPASPPISFRSSKAPTARKRTSDEFAMDHGVLVSKHTGSPLASSKDADKVRRHRSLGSGGASTTPAARERERLKERRRTGTGTNLGAGALNVNTVPKSPTSNSLAGRDAHSRHPSSSSTTSPQEITYRRQPDFSHLPPSPSAHSIHQAFNKAAASGAAPGNSPTTATTAMHHSASVAQSLLRGTQEGWNALDDSATAEMLRKLDGIPAKSARARSSVGSLKTSSRPGTPGMVKSSSTQWEGIEGGKPDGVKSKRASREEHSEDTIRKRASLGGESLKEGLKSQRSSVGKPQADKDHSEDSGRDARSLRSSSSKELLAHAAGKMDVESLIHSTDYPIDDSTGWSSQPSPPSKKTVLKEGTASARSSYGVPKRGSTSSTNFTGTPTSRDSTSMSTAATSVTSPSLSSGRYSSKLRRNSAGSDVSSVYSGDAAAARDRAAALASSGNEGSDDATAKIIPPVPPLPKAYQSGVPPSLSLPSVSSQVPPPALSPSVSTSQVHSIPSPTITTSQDPTPTAAMEARPPMPTSVRTAVEPPTPSSKSLAPPAHKTPTKKWSFSNALNLKLHSSSEKEGKDKDRHSLHPPKSPLSPRASKQSIASRSSNQEEQPASASSKLSENWMATDPQSPRLSESWTPIEKSEASPRTSIHRNSPQTAPSVKSGRTRTPDRGPSRSSETGSSASTHTTSALSATSAHPPSGKRLTPSAIPFFRRASSQSMQAHASGSTSSTPPPPPQPHPHTMHKGSSSAGSNIISARPPMTPPSEVPLSPSTSTTKRPSTLSLGLSSLLKSSSRKSLVLEKGDEAKLKEAVAKVKKEDRSESRISVLMGRKRGKTLSSTDEKKKKEAAPSAVNLPPIQMSLPNSTIQRVASLRQSGMHPPSSTTSTSSSLHRMSTHLAKTSSAGGSSTASASGLTKGSDSSLRLRAQLPTIAGSPSVSTSGTGNNGVYGSMSSSQLSKETPTKIPRIASRSSNTTSPAPAVKSTTSLIGSRRTSLNVGASSAEGPPSPHSSLAEFGILEDSENSSSPSKTVTGSTRRLSVARASPQSTTTRVPRTSTTGSTAISSSASTSAIRKPIRESMGFGLRKPSTASISSVSSSMAPPSASENTAPASSTTRPSRFSALSPSKSLKLLNAKVSSARSADASSSSLLSGSPSSSRQSLSTPSPAPDDDEVLGDREMMDYIRRQQARRLATGAKPEELEELLNFPEPIPPKPAMTPAEVLSGAGLNCLSDYEREEINQYPSVYYYGNIKDKKAATRDHSQYNYSYDDERGDYQVINHDHLAYRYEIIDTLGKGSFGQVLHCRDHCSGLSVAIKMIRNKQRFHHQGLVEIKILDNLRKWDPDEKHHVIKMQEYFYFRNHLCIAMELLSINLYELIKANGFVGFSTNLIRRFTTQMLSSLALMRHHRVVHCDLKPENVLLRHPAKSAIKVIDFGSSCLENEKVYTYLQSRFYRSPEIILGMSYSMAIDMWSLGCILAELYTGYPIFPGENEQEQLACIMEVLGVPDKDLIRRSSRQKLFFDASGQPRPVVNSKGRRRRPGSKTLADVLKCQDEVFLDFIAKCLQWDPERRLKPAPALRHPFIAQSRRLKPASPAPPSSSSRSLLSSSSSRKTVTETPKKMPETPKKSLISGPTPLTARSTHRQTAGSSVPPTPIASTVSSSSRGYRASQPSTYSLSSRHLNGYSSSGKS